MPAGQMQERNTEQVRLLSSDLQPRYEPNFAWKSCVSQYMALTGLRGFWSMSTVGSAGNVPDSAVQGRTLTYNGDPVFGYTGLAPWIYFDGTGDYLSRADEAGLDTLGTETYIHASYRGMTVGGWFRFDDGTPAGVEYAMSKRAAAGNISWQLAHNVAGTVNFLISGDCTATVAATSTGTTGTGWVFIAGRFDPSTEVAVFLNSEKVTNVAAIPASVCNSTADFNISGYNNGTALMTGYASLCFLSAAMLSDGIIYSLYHQSRAMFGV